MRSNQNQETISLDGVMLRGPESLRGRMEAALAALSVPGYITGDTPDISTYQDVDPDPRWKFSAESASTSAELKAWVERQD